MRIIALASLLALLAITPAAQAADTVDLIVGRDPGLTAGERAEVRADAGVELERHLRIADAEIVSVAAAEAAEALRTLRADPDVRWAQLDEGVRATAVTGADTHWSQLWGVHNTGQFVVDQSGFADADMDGPEAWALSTGAGVTVGVVDTGVAAAHEDLAGKLATNAGEVGAGREANGADDDADGYIDNWRGWDFVYGDNDPSDVHGHGSHVSGTIAAVNGNGKGISGLAPDAKILNLKGLGDTGNGPWSGLAEAFDYAGDRGIRVVNASLGGVGAVPLIDQVVSEHPNTLYVVAAGNDNADLDATTYYPCEAVHPNVLCVGASDNRDARAGFSNYSPTAVDVFAPGVRVLSTVPSGGYSYYNGTSMAAPHVAALAALLAARDPALTAVQIKQAILDSAEPKAALAAYGRNGGRANARAALAALDTPGDSDGDGVPNTTDNCPSAANPAQADADSDGLGDACDATPRGADPDGDGVGVLDDNCPSQYNASQRDTDKDGLGDICDPTPNGPDADGDGVPDAKDGCPAAFDPAQGDWDGDGIGDACDPTPYGPAEEDDPEDATPPPPVVGPIKVSVPSQRCGSRACVRVLRLTVNVTGGSGTARVSFSSQRCKRGKCTWKATAARASIMLGASSTVRVKLAAGRYRVIVSVPNAAPRTSTITLR